MINKIIVELNLPDNIRLPYIGSVLHGVLMNYLPDNVADSLHHDFAYSPLKQRVYYQDDKKIWEIISMSDNLFNELLNLFSQNSELYLKHYQTLIVINNFSIEKINIQTLLDKFLHDENLNRYIRLNVKTPTSFKTNGNYMIFPDIKKMFRSIMIQFDTFFTEYKLYDKETLDFLVENVKIIDYKMKSVRFHLEKVKIPSFTGEIVLKVNGPLPFLQLVHFLVAYGEFSGTGIKTSLGMGKYEIVETR